MNPSTLIEAIEEALDRAGIEYRPEQAFLIEDFVKKFIYNILEVSFMEAQTYEEISMLRGIRECLGLKREDLEEQRRFKA